MFLPGDPFSKGAVLLGHVFRDVVLTPDLSRASGEFSRASGSNPLWVVAMLAAQNKPALFCRQVTETFPQSVRQIRNDSLEFPSFFSHQTQNVHTIS